MILSEHQAHDTCWADLKGSDVSSLVPLHLHTRTILPTCPNPLRQCKYSYGTIAALCVNQCSLRHQRMDCERQHTDVFDTERLTHMLLNMNSIHSSMPKDLYRDVHYSFSLVKLSQRTNQQCKIDDDIVVLHHMVHHT